MEVRLMDFSQIDKMSIIIDYFSNNKNNNLKKFEYLVNVHSYNKNESIGKELKEKIRFGNLEQEQYSTNRVFIDIYSDQVVLQCVAEGSRNYTEMFDQKSRSYTLEYKIMMALNKWADYYNN